MMHYPKLVMQTWHFKHWHTYVLH